MYTATHPEAAGIAFTHVRWRAVEMYGIPYVA